MMLELTRSMSALVVVARCGTGMMLEGLAAIATMVEFMMAVTAATVMVMRGRIAIAVIFVEIVLPGCAGTRAEIGPPSDPFREHVPMMFRSLVRTVA